MDVLYLREADVERLLTMEIALEAVETAFRRAATGEVQSHSRRRLHPRGGAMLHYMAAADEATGYLGLKIYTSSPAGVRFLVPLYRVDSGALVALLEGDFLGRMRTGAASGVATKYMARADAARVGMLGSGHQAPTQLLALAQVRRLQQVSVYSPNAQHRRAFAERMEAVLSVPVEAVAHPEAAVREADLVVAVTSAREPVLRGDWLSPGAHINAVGANSTRRRELDQRSIERTDRIVVDSREQSQQEAGDLIGAFRKLPERWQTVGELSEVVAGKALGRRAASEITLFKSNGVALEDVATAVAVYEAARREGVGRTLTLWE